MDPKDSSCGPSIGKSLSRSASQPAVFPPKLLEKRINQLMSIRHGGAISSSGTERGRHEDDLDIIKQIIEKDESLHKTPDQLRETGIHWRSQSLSHIPGEFSHSASSLPALHHADSLHILQHNYYSAPDFSQLRSPPSYENSVTNGSGSVSKFPSQLRHESRSSSMSDFHAPDQQNVFLPTNNNNRRNSSFDSQASTQIGTFTSTPDPITAGSNGSYNSDVSMFDFSSTGGLRDNQQPVGYSDADAQQTPGSGYDFSRRGSSTALDLVKCFQFPSQNTTSSSTPLKASSSNQYSVSMDNTPLLQQQGKQVMFTASSEGPLRAFLTSDSSSSSNGAQVAPVSNMMSPPFSNSCKTITRVENITHPVGEFDNPSCSGQGECVFVCVCVGEGSVKYLLAINVARYTSGKHFFPTCMLGYESMRSSEARTLGYIQG